MTGLQYLHSLGVLFCDLKPSNVLVDEYGVVKLSDFGLSRRVPQSPASNGRGIGQGGDDASSSGGPRKRGTPYYMAPELFLDEGVHSYGSDLWALGCVLFELRVGYPPWAAANLSNLIRNVLYDPPVFPADNGAPNNSGLGANAPTSAATNASSSAVVNAAAAEVAPSPAFRSLLAQLLRKDPSQRSSWSSALSHPFWDATQPPPRARLPPQPAYEACLAAVRARLPPEPAPPTQRSDAKSSATAAATDAAAAVEAAAQPPPLPPGLIAPSPLSRERDSSAGGESGPPSALESGNGNSDSFAPPDEEAKSGSSSGSSGNRVRAGGNDLGVNNGQLREEIVRLSRTATRNLGGSGDDVTLPSADVEVNFFEQQSRQPHHAHAGGSETAAAAAGDAAALPNSASSTSAQREGAATMPSSRQRASAEHRRGATDAAFNREDGNGQEGNKDDEDDDEDIYEDRGVDENGAHGSSLASEGGFGPSSDEDENSSSGGSGRPTQAKTAATGTQDRIQSGSQHGNSRQKRREPTDRQQDQHNLNTVNGLRASRGRGALSVRASANNPPITMAPRTNESSVSQQAAAAAAGGGGGMKEDLTAQLLLPPTVAPAPPAPPSASEPPLEPEIHGGENTNSRGGSKQHGGSSSVEVGDNSSSSSVGGAGEISGDGELWAWEEEVGGCGSVAALLISAADLTVRPIIFNRAIEVIEPPPFQPHTLPFRELELSEVASLGDQQHAPQLEAHLTEVYKALAAKTLPVAEKVPVLAYLYKICKVDAVANVVVNSSFQPLLFKMARRFKSPALRVLVVTLLGALVRHATLIVPDLGDTYPHAERAASSSSSSSNSNHHNNSGLDNGSGSGRSPSAAAAAAGGGASGAGANSAPSTPGLFLVLLDLLKEPHAKLRRRAMAALGELTFYVATLDSSDAHAPLEAHSAPLSNHDNNHGGSSSNSNAVYAGASDTASSTAAIRWHVPSSLAAALARCLQEGEDDIVCHYAAKTVENVLAVAPLTQAKRLCTQEMALRLMDLTLQSQHRGTTDALHLTAATALALLLRRVLVADANTSHTANTTATAIFEGAGLDGTASGPPAWSTPSHDPSHHHIGGRGSPLPPDLEPAPLVSYAQMGPNSSSSSSSAATLGPQSLLSPETDRGSAVVHPSTPYTPATPETPASSAARGGASAFRTPAAARPNRGTAPHSEHNHHSTNSGAGSSSSSSSSSSSGAVVAAGLPGAGAAAGPRLVARLFERNAGAAAALVSGACDASSSRLQVAYLNMIVALFHEDGDGAEQDALLPGGGWAAPPPLLPDQARGQSRAASSTIGGSPSSSAHSPQQPLGSPMRRGAAASLATRPLRSLRAQLAGSSRLIAGLVRGADTRGAPPPSTSHGGSHNGGVGSVGITSAGYNNNNSNTSSSVLSAGAAAVRAKSLLALRVMCARFPGVALVTALEKGLLNKLERLVAAPEVLEQHPDVRSAALSLLVWLVAHAAHTTRVLATECHILALSADPQSAAARHSAPLTNSHDSRSAQLGGDNDIGGGGGGGGGNGGSGYGGDGKDAGLSSGVDLARHPDRGFPLGSSDHRAASPMSAAAASAAAASAGAVAASSTAGSSSSSSGSNRLAAAASAFPAVAHLVLSPATHETLTAAPNFVDDLARLLDFTTDRQPSHPSSAGGGSTSARSGNGNRPDSNSGSSGSKRRLDAAWSAAVGSSSNGSGGSGASSSGSSNSNGGPASLTTRALLQHSVLAALQGLATHADPLLLDQRAVVAHRLVPSVSRLLRAPGADARAHGLALLRLLLPPLVVVETSAAAEGGVRGEANSSQERSGVRDCVLTLAVARLVLPLCPALVLDQEPIPQFVLALLLDLAGAWHPLPVHGSNNSGGSSSGDVSLVTSFSAAMLQPSSHDTGSSSSSVSIVDALVDAAKRAGPEASRSARALMDLVRRGAVAARGL